MVKNRVHPVGDADGNEPDKRPNLFEASYKKFSEHVDGIRPGRGRAKFKNKQWQTDTSSNGPKKPFDKKTWRLKTYSNKYKLDKWEERRKKQVLKDYYRNVKGDSGGAGAGVRRLYDEEARRDGDVATTRINYVVHPDVLERLTGGAPAPHGRVSALKAAQAEYERLKREKRDRKSDYLRRKAEKESALAEYRTKKAEKFKKLSRRTTRGQPVMKGRIELMLEKIQASVNGDV